MQDYTKLTKAEIIEKLVAAEVTIAKQEHLASAVHAKDNEISKLTAENRQLIKDRAELELLRIIKKDTLAGKDNIVKMYDDKVAQLQKDHDLAFKTVSDNYRADTDGLKKLLDRRVAELNELINVHGAFLKASQGALDLAISLNEKFVTNIQK